MEWVAHSQRPVSLFHSPLLLPQSAPPRRSGSQLSANAFFPGYNPAASRGRSDYRSEGVRTQNVPPNIELPVSADNYKSSHSRSPSPQTPSVLSPIDDAPVNSGNRRRSSRHSPRLLRTESRLVSPRSANPYDNYFPVSSQTPLVSPLHGPSLDDSKRIRFSFPTIYDSQAFWLLLYFFFNLSLTLYNKGVLMQFPFPYTLTAIHALCGTIGGYGYMFLTNGPSKSMALSRRDHAALIAFSVLYTINIAVSNISLHMVTVPFHQVVRATTPIFAILLSACLFGARSSRRKILSLIPVVAGVGLATYGDYYYTLSGLILTILGTFLAALKTVLTNVLQSEPPQKTPHSSSSNSQTSPSLIPRLGLAPLDLLTRMAPLAFVQCLFLAQMTGELDHMLEFRSHMSIYQVCALVTNGIIAFGLNVVSFTANKKAGALSMTVAANVKQVLTIFLAVVIFKLTITSMNACGIILTLAGGAWYAAVEYQEKQRRMRT